ncbi:MAG TPA: polyprenyl synthetase family protein [Polyangiales bacterium]|nr:polyprenyl synthetase family protein [Polyangiales bacterium]
MSQPWTGQVVLRVNDHLTAFFADKRAQLAGLTPHAFELVDAAAELTMRGGKRLRCLLMFAAFRSAGGEDRVERLLDAMASIELLQTYLLIQDDWMDDDTQRRGGPAVHAAFAEQRKNPKLGASLGILTSDLAAGFAFELLHRTAVGAVRAGEILAAYDELHREVLCGQQLDLLQHSEVEHTHDLKSGSYSVRGPMRVGALIANASAEQLAVLERFGRPLGVAFQLRDDLLGTFGDPRLTGKPAGHDLRAGKNTTLVREARGLMDAAGLALLDRVLGNQAASPAELADATRAIESSGARARVEARLAALANQAEEALRSPLSAEGLAMLRELLNLVVLRDR